MANRVVNKILRFSLLQKKAERHERRTTIACARLGAGSAIAVVAALSSAPAVAAASHIRTMTSSIGALIATLSDPAATANDFFGTSVAVSGTTAVVGAYDTNSAQGTAYIYTKTTAGWSTTPAATLSDPAGAVDDVFGWSVAVSGTTAVIGAPGANRTYFYTKKSTGWSTVPAVTLSDPNATGGRFGESVAVSGTTAVVGAIGDNALRGAAYIYKKTANGWSKKPAATLSDPAATSYDYFGYSVAISGETAVVGGRVTNPPSTGQGAAYIYTKTTAGWSTIPAATLPDPAVTANDYFGYSVTVSGTTAVVGASGTNSDQGKAYIYTKTTAGWSTTPAATLSDPAARIDDGFGNSVAVSGTEAVVGSAGGNTAYIYTKKTAGWSTNPAVTLSDPAATVDDYFGSSVAVSGKTTVVSAPETSSGQGTAYIYNA